MLEKALQKKTYNPCKGRSTWGAEAARMVRRALATKGLSSEAMVEKYMSQYTSISSAA
jgi:hypothetical protein